MQRTHVARHDQHGFSRNPECLLLITMLSLTLSGVMFGIKRSAHAEGAWKFLEPAFFGLLGFMVVPTIMMIIWLIVIIRRRFRK